MYLVFLLEGKRKVVPLQGQDTDEPSRRSSTPQDALTQCIAVRKSTQAKELEFCLPETTLITDHGREMRSDLLSCRKLSCNLWYDHTWEESHEQSSQLIHINLLYY